MRRTSLAWRIFGSNAAVLVAASLALILSPATVSAPVTASEAAILVGGIAAILFVNLLLIGRAFAPLRRLADVMRDIDPLAPGRRVVGDSADDEVLVLADTFNEMIGRLEDERRESARVGVMAQEQERIRIGQELHDELGQSLTGVLLSLDGIAATVEPEARQRVEDVRTGVRQALEEARRIARDLRPETLDDLGLPSALTSLGTTFARASGVVVERHISRALPGLGLERELVLYRVGQEALTNIARHAQARVAVISLTADGDRIVLRVDDDGVGLPMIATEGAGVRGMRERALLVRGRLSLGASPSGGTRVELSVPLAEA